MTEHIKVPEENDDQINTTLRETLPDKINNVELGSKEQKGLLSPLVDPIGKGLQNVLSPVGNLIGGTGDRMAAFTTQDQPKKKGGDGGYEKFGGKEQNGQNPLGL
ncbi:hypothetical protein D6C84_04510 [Aureobasidium pullulans]|uniref:Uncharacterized protein n=1 Tax=Aureobasidium pullulans TaxID=5580 RepID=A0A4S9XUW6_AURPU|nr:hypothetical protein D6C84_04510 [Aureobasidium pullulans]